MWSKVNLCSSCRTVSRSDVCKPPCCTLVFGMTLMYSVLYNHAYTHVHYAQSCVCVCVKTYRGEWWGRVGPHWMDKHLSDPWTDHWLPASEYTVNMRGEGEGEKRKGEERSTQGQGVRGVAERREWEGKSVKGRVKSKVGGRFCMYDSCITCTCTYMSLVFWCQSLYEFPGLVHPVHLPQLVWGLYRDRHCSI